MLKDTPGAGNAPRESGSAQATIQELENTEKKRSDTQVSIFVILCGEIMSVPWIQVHFRLIQASEQPQLSDLADRTTETASQTLSPVPQEREPPSSQTEWRTDAEFTKEQAKVCYISLKMGNELEILL